MARRGRLSSQPAGILLVLAAAALGAPEGRAGGLPSTGQKQPGLGIVKQTAVEVCGPNGANLYFDRLRCPDGSVVRYERAGSEGFRNEPTSKADQEAARIEMMTSAPIPEGQKDFHTIDAYTVECSAGKSFLYVDRYHCPDPKDQGPPPGFTFDRGRAAGSPSTDSKPSGLGLAKQTPVEVCGPSGARDYLDRLRCPDGSAVRSQRTGSMGVRSDPSTKADEEAMRGQFMSSGPIPSGQKDFHLIDGFSAACAEQKIFLYLDVYHCPDPKNQGPPPGLSLAGHGTPR
jgi:hypothetical protein